MLCFRRFVVFHSKTLKSMANVSLNRSTSFSSKPPEMSSKVANESVGEDLNDNKKQLANSWKVSDREIDLFGPKDIRAPLNGNVGVVTDENMTTIDVSVRQVIDSMVSERQIESDLASFDSRFQQMNAISHGIKRELDHKSETQTNAMSSLLECVAHKCPILLLNDFLDLFPQSRRPDLSKGLTVVTLCQKTVNDMSAWTSQVDDEREDLMKHFVSVANKICAHLKAIGFWADFIDPSSGRPFLGEYTNATMFETDERYRYFGFEIEDLGCCKVISHHLWGTHSFVGALFTSAPISSPELQKVLINFHEKD